MSIAFDNANLVRLDDRAYFDTVLAAAEHARRRIWASLFICDIRPQRDIEGQVMDLMATLIARRAWGVDVRVVLTADANVADIALANLATGLYLDASGVPVRRVGRQPDGRLGTHAKFAVFDDIAILGSQNWTDDGFRVNIEDAVLLRGDPVDRLGGEFLRLWNLGGGLPRAV